MCIVGVLGDVKCCAYRGLGNVVFGRATGLIVVWCALAVFVVEVSESLVLCDARKADIHTGYARTTFEILSPPPEPNLACTKLDRLRGVG